jgi:hypothetical protein
MISTVGMSGKTASTDADTLTQGKKNENLIGKDGKSQADERQIWYSFPFNCCCKSVIGKRPCVLLFNNLEPLSLEI